MKKIIFFIFLYITFSIIYVISGFDFYLKCYQSVSNYKNCLSIEYVEGIIKFPALTISQNTPIKFIWNSTNKGIRIGNYSYGGLKIGDKIIFQSWQRFFSI